MSAPLPPVLSPRALGSVDDLSASFARATPFRHVVIDDFLDAGFARRLAAQFPDFDRGDSLGEDGKPGGKSTFEGIRALGEAYERLDDVLRSRDFLALVGRITGIDGLIYDPWYLGGGTHENRDGARLDPHIDFNFHPLHGWHRRLNLLVYLNERWDPAWGGALGLYRDPREDAAPVVEIAPAFNRCVIFETTDRSWHGFERIRLPDPSSSASRRSIAVYFYSPAIRSADAADEAHSTVYVARPLPAHLRAGHALTGEDMAELQRLLADRDGRVAQQYREIARLMTLVRAHERGFAGAMLYALRRLGARLRRARP